MAWLWLLVLLAVAACSSSYADHVAATCERGGTPRGSADYWTCVRQVQATDLNNLEQGKRPRADDQH
jgi:hypothetical protein